MQTRGLTAGALCTSTRREHGGRPNGPRSANTNPLMWIWRNKRLAQLTNMQLGSKAQASSFPSFVCTNTFQPAGRQQRQRDAASQPEIPDSLTQNRQLQTHSKESWPKKCKEMGITLGVEGHSWMALNLTEKCISNWKPHEKAWKYCSVFCVC